MFSPAPSGVGGGMGVRVGARVGGGFWLGVCVDVVVMGVVRVGDTAVGESLDELLMADSAGRVGMFSGGAVGMASGSLLQATNQMRQNRQRMMFFFMLFMVTVFCG